jgi:hypothetical protein
MWLVGFKTGLLDQAMIECLLAGTCMWGGVLQTEEKKKEIYTILTSGDKVG